MGSSKRVSLAVMLVVMAAANVLLAEDKAKQLYDFRYADQRKQVDATSGKTDDVALAKQHLKDTEKYASTPELVKVILEQAYELGVRDVTGYVTAAQSIDLLIAKFPNERASYVDKAIRVYDLQVRRSQDREAAGEKLIALLLEQAAAEAAKDEFGKSVDLASNANSIASIVKSSRKAEVSAVWKYYQARRDLKITPSNGALRMAVIRMCVVELDDPAVGAILLTGDMSEQLRTYVPLAAEDPAQVKEAACLELGNWYVELAKEASEYGKAICLNRAVAYLERFLSLHKAEDTSRTQGKLLLDKAQAERKKFGVATKSESKPGEGNILTLNLANDVAMKLVLIPAGKFLMGSPKTDTTQNKDGREGSQHEVTISKPFYMGVTEVTQEQYASIMGKNPSKFVARTNPVEQVTWNDAVEFCRKLSQKTGKTVRLPTEAEWEYACRAGSKTRFCFGDGDNGLASYAWYIENGNRKTHPVGMKKANAWDLYDMHGNVREWCADWYADSYANARPVDPKGPASGSSRVLRGGSWFNYPRYCRSAYRGRLTPGGRDNRIGFRVVVPLD